MGQGRPTPCRPTRASIPSGLPRTGSTRGRPERRGRADGTTASVYHEHPLPDLRGQQPVDRAMMTAFAKHVRTLDPPAVLDVRRPGPRPRRRRQYPAALRRRGPPTGLHLVTVHNLSAEDNVEVHVVALATMDRASWSTASRGHVADLRYVPQSRDGEPLVASSDPCLIPAGQKLISEESGRARRAWREPSAADENWVGIKARPANHQPLSMRTTVCTLHTFALRDRNRTPGSYGKSGCELKSSLKHA